MSMRRVIKMGRLAAVMCAVVASLVASSPTYGDAKAALVLETSGTSVPLLQPYSEIAAGTTVSLPDGASLVFLHYAACRTATVVGGVITFEENTYRMIGGSERSAMRGQCPRIEVLRSSGETAGILFRKGPSISLTLSPQPSFVLVGKRASDFRSIQVSSEGRVIVQAPLEGRRFRWPDGAAALTRHTIYELILVPRTAEIAPVTAKFRVGPSGSHASSEELILVRVE